MGEAGIHRREGGASVNAELGEEEEEGRIPFAQRVRRRISKGEVPFAAGVLT